MSADNEPRRQTKGSNGYRPEYAHQVRKLSQLGLDEEHLAFFFEVNVGTIARWKREHPEFRSGIEAGAPGLVSTIEPATVANIIGHYATKERVVRGKVIELRRWVPGNAYAGMRWLSTRCPDRLSPD